MYIEGPHGIRWIPIHQLEQVNKLLGALSLLSNIRNIRCPNCSNWMSKRIHPSYFKGYRFVWFCPTCLRLDEWELE